MSFKYTIKINGTEVTSGNLINMNYTKIENKWAIVDLELIPSAIDTFSINQGDAVTIQYGPVTGLEYYRFRGTVETISPISTTVVISCFDKLYQLTKKHANESYDKNDSLAGKISSIIIDLITQFGKLNADSSSIQDTGTLTVQEKLFCFDSIVFEKVLELCKVVGYIISYNANDDKVYAFEKGYYSNPDSFEVGVNIIGKPKWTDSAIPIINYLRLYGGSRTTTKVEYFTGTGAQDTFTLSYVPDKKSDVRVEEDVAGTWTERIFGRTGTTLTYDYTIDDDPKIKTVKFQAGSIPAIGVNNVRVTYAYVDVLYTERWDEASKNLYPLGDDTDNQWREAILFNNYIITIDDLENTADSLISSFNNPYESVSFGTVLLSDIPKIGYQANVTDSVNGRNRTGFIIKEVKFSYPSGQNFNVILGEVTSDVNDLLYSSVQRLRRLEEDSRGNLSFVRVSARNSPVLEMALIQIISEFEIANDTWNIADTWSTSDTWGTYNSRDDFGIDLTGTQWDEVSGTWNVTSSFYYEQTNASGTHYSLWDGNTTAFQDPDITFKLRKVTGHTCGILFRFDGTDGYCIRYKDTSKIELGTFNVSTGFSQIAEYDLSRALNVWTYLRVAMKGTSLLLLWSDDKINWRKVFSATDSSFANAGKIGFYTFDTDADFDDIKMGEVIELEVDF